LRIPRPPFLRTASTYITKRPIEKGYSRAPPEFRYREYREVLLRFKLLSGTHSGVNLAKDRFYDYLSALPYVYYLIKFEVLRFILTEALNAKAYPNLGCSYVIEFDVSYAPTGEKALYYIR
ncbi:uncharacterized protein N7496_010740, partial [Penicillium cataractarum]